MTPRQIQLVSKRVHWLTGCTLVGGPHDDYLTWLQLWSLFSRKLQEREPQNRPDFAIGICNKVFHFVVGLNLELFFNLKMGRQTKIYSQARQDRTDHLSVVANRSDNRQNIISCLVGFCIHPFLCNNIYMHLERKKGEYIPVTLAW